MRLIRELRYLALPLAALLALLCSAPVAAQATPAAGSPGLQVENHGGALHITWSAAAQAASAEGAPLVPYGGYLLPVTSLLIELPTGSTVAADNVQVSAVPYAGDLIPAPAQLPPALDWEPDPALVPRLQTGLPTAPLMVAGQGMQRGRALAVVTFSPIFQDAATGEVRYAESLSASIAGARPATQYDALAAPDDAARFTPVAALADAPGPTNPLAGGAAVKLIVEQPGLQVISGSAVAAAGLNTPATATLRLFLGGVEVPVQIIDGGASGQLDAGDQVRFFTPTVGDAANSASVYWLVAGNQNGLRMATRSVAPGGAPVRTMALEPGVYYVPTLFDTLVAGPDGDHYFVASADIEPDGSNVTFDVTLPHRLPLATGKTGSLTLRMAAKHVVADPDDCAGTLAHRVRVALGGATLNQQFDAAFGDDCLQNNLAQTFAPIGDGDKLTVTLLKDDVVPLSVKFDVIEYALPVNLDFGGGGAIFAGDAGAFRYRLSNTAADRTVYDITVPAAPQILTGLSGNTFQDAGARRYLVSGSGVVFTPRAESHAKVTFKESDAAHIVYIAPAEFMDALQPLIALRQAQGYTAKAVDVQTIFDAWSFGMADPRAIRSFLRFAVGHWQPAPLAAVLVGDGTSDPRDYLGFANANRVPPYMAPVDPWIGYVPCDNCFGQLDGDDALGEPAFLMDIWIGRLPANTIQEVQIMVDKIVRYENDKENLAAWRGNTLQVVDDYFQADGVLDPAGNFPQFAEEIIALQPAGIRVRRNYYGASTNFSSLPASLATFLQSVSSYFVGDPKAAAQRTIDYASNDIALFTFTGHANHYKYAEVCPPGASKGDPSCGNMLGLWDVLKLRNHNNLFVMLSMTCYTAQFTKPAAAPVTMDENMIVHAGGGAVAVWGPAGLSVSHGHDTLQQGFHNKLWSQPPQKAKLGALVEAGYLAVNASPSARDCCSDVNKTFLILGDPFTPVRVQEVDALRLPAIHTPGQ
jgi:hypothetical protein